jgi:anaerobic magnesium-protoporphyrin IX monomethyl ester cyclase
LKVLLCQSYLGPKSREPLVFPLGLSYLAASIKNKHDVTCFDPNVAEDPLNELSNLIDKIQPDVVGVSFRNIDGAFSYKTHSFYEPFLSIIQLIKTKVPYAKVIVGGPGFSIFAEEVMKNTPQIDIGMIGEGEVAFPELLENLDRADQVKSLLIRKNGKIVSTGKRELIDFNSAPFPARELFNIKKYRERPFALGIQARRGCSFNCAFCANRNITGDYFRLRSPKKVVDEIEHVVNDFDIDSFYFADATFNYPIEHAKEICDEITRRKLKVRWQADFHLLYLNQQFMESAVQSGCDLFSFSPDGASDRALSALGKNFGVDTIRQSISLTKNVAGANAGYSFLYDLPRYNMEHVKGLMKLAPEMMVRLRSKLRFISYSKIRIYPNTAVYDLAVKDGKITRESSLLCPVHYTNYQGGSNNIPDSMVSLLRASSVAFDKVSKTFKR